MRRNLLVVLALSVLLLVGGASGAWAEVHVIVGQGADITGLDPHGENDQPSARVRVQIYDTLIALDNEMNITPGLAVSWTEIDDVTTEFKIREGVSFHNGETLTAHDVKFTFDRMRDPATRASAAHLLDAVEEVQVVDDYTVRIVTDNPFGPLLIHLGHSATGILNEKAVTEAGDNYGTQVAVGTGPFKFVRWATGSHVELAKNADYWQGVPQADRLTIRGIPENTVRAIEVETGGIDIAYDLEPIDELRLEFDPNINIVKYDTFATHYIGFNAQKAPFDNVLVRQAINHAVDVEAVVEYIYTGQAVRATSAISPMVWASHPDLEPYDFDPEKAKALLAEAGYADGFKTSIWTNDNPLRMQIAELFQANLADIGIEVEIQVLPWATYLEDTAAGRHDMFILGWVSVTGDPDYGLYPLFHSSQYGATGNRTFWSTPRSDELLDLGKVTVDADERMAYYYEAQEIIRDEAPWVFLIATSAANGVRSNVTGFETHPTGAHRLWTVSKH